ncbi:hypothetical protein AYI83_10280 [Shewanella algae]|uniref:hypothetical protein n=1 Tax=Shewanella algae TaxID=38313 RepID=UPI0011844E6E|nr:hypothetical protein [Shewanella algae]TVK97542.1 hypothetical protein AYI83_10280 [Shewanella algae]
MITPLPNETFHSLIVRNAMVKVGSIRLTELKGIISYDGHWKTFPKIIDNSLLSGYSRSDILGFISNMCPAIGIYYKPDDFDLNLIYEYIFNDESFFFDELIINNTSLIPSRVKYCSECFREQILNYGVSYFKIEWYNSFACSVHSIKLMDVKVRETLDDKRINVYKFIDLLMRCQV